MPLSIVKSSSWRRSLNGDSDILYYDGGERRSGKGWCGIDDIGFPKAGTHRVHGMAANYLANI